MVIGVSGINYYADDARHLIMTADFDIFLKPELNNLTKALKVMEEMEFTISTKKRITKRLDETSIKAILADRGTIVCTNPHGNIIEFCLEVSGFTYEELDRNVRVFHAGRSRIRVGSLQDLLRMKEIAARDKDLLFLKKYRQMLEE